jgi:hypothetical protein
MAEPKWKKSITANADPRRAKLLIANELAHCTKSNTDNAEPKLAKDLNDKEAPK